MRCDDMQELVSPYIDGELGLMTGIEVERHLRDCPVCSLEYENHRALRAALQTNNLYIKPPAGLERRVQAAVRQINRDDASRSDARGRGFSWRWVSIAATAILLIAGTLAIAWLTTRSTQDRLANEVIASHVRALMASHLTDVLSSDQHTVKPWFNGKLDFSPPVKDLINEGFPLIGGRLDYLDNRPVAAVVYQHRQHYINLFVWTATAEHGKGDGEVSQQGYNVIHWTSAGMNYWAVSDLNSAELQQFVALLRNQ